MPKRSRQLVYKLWAPIYDYFFNKGAFLGARRKVYGNLPFEKGAKLLFAGVGTGVDLEQISLDQYEVTGIDFSAEMLAKAQEKFKGKPVTLLRKDARQTDYEDEYFDAIIASLLITVVPDPEKAFAEFLRITKKGGYILFFDKFAPEAGRLPLIQRLLRPVVSVLGTDIGLKFGELANTKAGQFTIILNEPIMLNGMYRKILLKKNE